MVPLLHSSLQEGIFLRPGGLSTTFSDVLIPFTVLALLNGSLEVMTPQKGFNSYLGICLKRSKIKVKDTKTDQCLGIV